MKNIIYKITIGLCIFNFIVGVCEVTALKKKLDYTNTQLQQEKILYHECYDENYELSQKIIDLKGFIEQYVPLKH